MIAKWQREFDELRTRRTLVPANRESAVWDHYTAVLERDDEERGNMAGEAEIEVARNEVLRRVDKNEIKGIDPLALLDATLELQLARKVEEVSADTRKVKLADLRKLLAKGETALIAHEVEECLRQNGLFVARSTRPGVSIIQPSLLRIPSDQGSGGRIASMPFLGCEMTRSLASGDEAI